MPAAPRQVFVRIGILLAALGSAFAAALAGLHAVDRRGVQEIIDEERREHSRLLDGALDLASKPLQLFTDGYARRSSITRFDTDPRGGSAETILRTGLRAYGAVVVWLVDADGTLKLVVADEMAPPPSPVSARDLAGFRTRRVRFFFEDRHTLYEVHGTRLAINGANPDAPRGWLFAARQWDAVNLAWPRLPVEGHVSLLTPGQAAATAAGVPHVRIERVLRDVRDQPLRILRLDYNPEEVQIAQSTNWLDRFVLAAFGVIALGVLGLCLWRWILVPAGLMRQSLATQDETHLQPLFRSGGALGQLALLVQNSITTQKKLERTLAERSRLGRELHDGVIQTVYAAGMSLASVRATLRENPDEADRVLAETHEELNATIRDLRAFIRGAETAPMTGREFGAAVRSAVAVMQGIRPITASLELDEAVAQALTSPQCLHLLQVIRESVSNSVRHSHADRITIRLRREPAGILLEIADNGAGMKPSAANPGGFGLGNIAARARELGGTVDISHQPSGGVRITLIVPDPA